MEEEWVYSRRLASPLVHSMRYFAKIGRQNDPGVVEALRTLKDQHWEELCKDQQKFFYWYMRAANV